MKIYNTILTIFTTIAFASATIAQETNLNQQDLEEKERAERSNRPIVPVIFRNPREGLPWDVNKTPTTPDTIYHYVNPASARNFYRKRIFFGTDQSGKPCYKRIREHAKDNPEFGNVGLVIFHQEAWHKLRFSDSFEMVGTYADESARNKLIDSMSGFWILTQGKGGVWCPEQNVFIGGTRDKNICDRFAEYLKQSETSKKIK